MSPREIKSLPDAARRDDGIGDAASWARLHRRLEDSRSALERRLNPHEKERRRILHARARALAAPSIATNTTAQRRLETVEFALGPEHYAIETSFIREIYPLSEFTPLPCTPAFVLGLVNVRGQILSIINIKKLFDLPEKGLTDLNKAIIVHNEGMEVGLLGDRILGVRSVALDELLPSLPTLTGIRAEYLKGITKDALIVLDIERILSDERLVINEEVNSATWESHAQGASS
jgi:purine-binding chemotaxis protein CheW